MLSIDYAFGHHTNRMAIVSQEYECPDRTPGFLFRYALPRLREKGLSEDLLRQFTAENPKTMVVQGGAGLAAGAPPP